MNKNTLNSTVTAMQGQIAKPNVQDEPTAESGSAPSAETGCEPQAGGGSAPSFCSASEVSDKHYCSHVVPDGYNGLEFCSDIGRVYVSRSQWELSQPYFKAWLEKTFSSPEWKPQELKE